MAPEATLGAIWAASRAVAPIQCTLSIDERSSDMQPEINFDLYRAAPAMTLTAKYSRSRLAMTQWERFRTVLHLSRVYGAGKGIEDYWTNWLKSVDALSKSLKEKLGLQGEDQHQDLMPVFGRYLAHYRVFKQLHAHAKKSQGEGKGAQVDSGAMPVGGAAVFPKEIQGLVDEGYKNLVSGVECLARKSGLGRASHDRTT